MLAETEALGVSEGDSELDCDAVVERDSSADGDILDVADIVGDTLGEIDSDGDGVSDQSQSSEAVGEGLGTSKVGSAVAVSVIIELDVIESSIVVVAVMASFEEADPDPDADALGASLRETELPAEIVLVPGGALDTVGTADDVFDTEFDAERVIVPTLDLLTKAETVIVACAAVVTDVRAVLDCVDVADADDDAVAEALALALPEAVEDAVALELAVLDAVDDAVADALHIHSNLRMRALLKSAMTMPPVLSTATPMGPEKLVHSFAPSVKSASPEPAIVVTRPSSTERM